MKQNVDICREHLEWESGWICLVRTVALKQQQYGGGIIREKWFVMPAVYTLNYMVLIDHIRCEGIRFILDVEDLKLNNGNRPQEQWTNTKVGDFF